MLKKQKLSVTEKAQKLILKIERTKTKLEKLRKKRIVECGKLVIKHGLDKIDNHSLNKALQKVAKELLHQTGSDNNR